MIVGSSSAKVPDWQSARVDALHHRIESGVHVAEPERQRRSPVRNEFGCERTYQGQYEEGQPAAGKGKLVQREFTGFKF